MAKIIIYTSSHCPFCTMAKRLFDNKGASYSEINIDSDLKLRQEMTEKTQRRTVPQIFIGTKHIGGFDDLRALDVKKELDYLL